MVGAMRIRAAFVTFMLFAGQAFAAGPPDAATAPQAELAPESRAVRLDAFFQTLKTSKDAIAAKEAEASIISLWLESGSDTVDLLMAWSLRAMQEKDYALALDYLDRITVMEPSFAEGWNKRATVYFLLENYARAISDIQKTLTLEPRHFGALSGLGVIFGSLGDDRRAMDAYRQALALDPHLSNVRDALEKLQKEAERNI